MKIELVKIEWNNKCCGCYGLIPTSDYTFIMSEIGGLDGSLHFCTQCVKEIVEECEKEKM